jgi:SAM-dependent methyltransferase
MLMLDIGAGDTSFARSFLRLNPHIQMHILCGEPHWSGVWRGQVKAGKVEKIKAKYNAFNLPDNCLDLVTLNAWHLLFALGGIQAELVRTLKPGGLFISAHPVDTHPKLPTEELFPVMDSHGVMTFHFSHQTWFWRTNYSDVLLPDGTRIRYPASPTIANRLLQLSLPEDFRSKSASYIYINNNSPPAGRLWCRK